MVLDPDVLDNLWRERLLGVVPGAARCRVHEQKGHRVDDGHRGDGEQDAPEQVRAHVTTRLAGTPRRPGAASRGSQPARIFTRPKVPYQAAAAGGSRNPCTRGLIAMIAP